MTVNRYFDLFSYTREQELLSDLTTELIQMVGIDIYYMPRSHVNIDQLWVEDTLSKFDQATTIEVMIKTFNGWQGQGDMMTMFGTTMADQITFSMSRTRWNDEFTTFQPNLIRPLEGDFIYLPMTNALFEVKFVEHEDTFYTTGSLTYYDIKCERVNYSNERIQTGVRAIDNIDTKYNYSDDSVTMTDASGDGIVDGSGNFIVTDDHEPVDNDPLAQNSVFSNEGASFIVKSNNPLGGG